MALNRISLSRAGAWFFLLTGCVVPRSVVFGQTARTPMRGAAELSVSAGAAFQSATTTNPTPAGGTSVTTRNFALPAGEANLSYGLTDMLALSCHLSPAGIQPGVKVAHHLGEWDVAVLPAFALSYASQGGSSAFTQNGATQISDTGGTSAVGFLLGFRALASMRQGVYFGLGYDLQQLTGTKLGTALQTPSSTTVSSHNLALAAGYELRLGRFALRPEVALLFVPATNVWATTGTTTAYSQGAFEVVFFPSLTLALGSSDSEAAARAPGIPPEELSFPPLPPFPP